MKTSWYFKMKMNGRCKGCYPFLKCLTLKTYTKQYIIFSAVFLKWSIHSVVFLIYELHLTTTKNTECCVIRVDQSTSFWKSGRCVLIPRSAVVVAPQTPLDGPRAHFRRRSCRARSSFKWFPFPFRSCFQEPFRRNVTLIRNKGSSFRNKNQSIRNKPQK